MNEREREREREGGRVREREREREGERGRELERERAGWRERERTGYLFQELHCDTLHFVPVSMAIAAWIGFIAMATGKHGQNCEQFVVA